MGDELWSSKYGVSSTDLGFVGKVTLVVQTDQLVVAGFKVKPGLVKWEKSLTAACLFVGVMGGLAVFAAYANFLEDDSNPLFKIVAPLIAGFVVFAVVGVGGFEIFHGLARDKRRTTETVPFSEVNSVLLRQEKAAVRIDLERGAIDVEFVAGDEDYERERAVELSAVLKKAVEGGS